LYGNRIWHKRKTEQLGLPGLLESDCEASRFAKNVITNAVDVDGQHLDSIFVTFV